MTVRLSSKCKEMLLGANSFPNIFNGGRILLFSGAQPDSADYPTQGSLLGQITDQGMTWAPNGAPGGLNFILSGVWAANDPSQAWQLVASAGGTLGWFRLVGRLVDNDDYSFAAPRIDGTVGTGGSVDMRLENAVVTAGYTVPLQQFLFSFPPVLGA